MNEKVWRKLTGLIGLHQKKKKCKYKHYGIPRKKLEKQKESIFKTKMAKNFPNLEREMGTQIHALHRNF